MEDCLFSSSKVCCGNRKIHRYKWIGTSGCLLRTLSLWELWQGVATIALIMCYEIHHANLWLDSNANPFQLHVSIHIQVLGNIHIGVFINFIIASPLTNVYISSSSEAKAMYSSLKNIIAITWLTIGRNHHPSLTHS